MMQLLQSTKTQKFGTIVALFSLLLLAPLAYADAAPSAPGPIAAATTAQAADEIIYVGTQSNQIHALRFNAADGTLRDIGVVETGLASTWLVANKAPASKVPVLYSVDDHTQSEGSITAFSADPADGTLRKINTVSTEAKGTTYLWLDKRSMTFLAANYGSGSLVSVAVNDDGSVGSLVSTVKETGAGPNRRQASAHAHSAAVDPSGRYVLVPDLGADRVFVYRFDRATRMLTDSAASGPAPFVAPPGTGPRHLVFGKDGQFVYLLTELSAEVMVLRWDASHGQLALVQTLPISSPQFNGVKSGAEIALSRDGRFVYVADRGEHTFVVYRVAPDAGTLSLVQRVSTGGERPWDFEIDASGKWIFVANQGSGSVRLFSIDTATGMVTDSGQSVDMAGPVSIGFLR
ncbi:lactonase family protein [Robbsia sp. KACC 23696]|uniref:lactonase family protein n=1 Tax=Robbsia sp. KACC 23696 TaxID=3149231 RepID=UPI00325BA6D9